VNLHESPNERQSRTRDSTSFVRNFDRNVLVSFGNDHFHRRVVLTIDSVCLYDSSEGILEDFEEYVVL
jgi:hypothetical protein